VNDKRTVDGVVRRVTVYRDRSGRWRFRAQAGNWREVGASEQGLKGRNGKAAILARVERTYPGVELVVVDGR